MASSNLNLEELAALYALDALDPEERGEAEAAFANLPQFAEEVAAFEAAAAAFAYNAPSMSVAADLKDRLFQRLDCEAAAPVLEQLAVPAAESSVAVELLKEQSVDLSWQSLPIPGASMATVEIDEERREITFFVRAETQARFPLHSHAAGEEIVVLEGDLVVDGEVYGSGDRICSDRGSIHQPETRRGCLLFVKTSLDDKVLS